MKLDFTDTSNIDITKLHVVLPYPPQLLVSFGMLARLENIQPRKIGISPKMFDEFKEGLGSKIAQDNNGIYVVIDNRGIYKMYIEPIDIDYHHISILEGYK